MREAGTETANVVTTIRLHPSLHKRLKEIAAKEHRTLGAELRRLVELRVQEFEGRA